MTENTQRIAGLQRELAANPTSRQFYQLGELLRRDGRFGEATEVLNAGLAHHPRYMAAWVALGRACLETGKAQDAVRGLEQALVLDPQNPVAWRLLGEARLVLGDRLGALDAMTRCLDLVPGDDVLQAAVDALAAETVPPAPPVEYAPMLEAVGTPPESALPVGEQMFELELPEAAPGAPEAVPAPPSRPGEEAAAPFLGSAAEAAPPAEPMDVFSAAPAAEEPFASADAGPGTVEAGPFEMERTVPLPAAELEFEPPPPSPVESVSPPVPAAAEVPPPATAPVGPPPVPEAPPLLQREVAAPLPFGGPAELPPELPAGPEAVPPPEPAPAQGEPVGEDIFAAPATEEAPALLHALSDASLPPVTRVPSEPPASLTLARLYLQQQAPDDAVRVLEQLLERQPANVEARDLLALIHDMMMPLPAAPPPLSPRERKIAALQRWLASLTLGWERAAR